jgi:protein phosphatase
MHTDAPLTRSGVVDFAAVSHPGHSRPRNEDFYFIAADKGLSVVADGVGGQGDGAWASRRAVELFSSGLDMHASHGREAEAVHDALQRTHREMVAETHRTNGLPGGTTIAGIWAPQQAAGKVTVFNVGDSPVFHFSRGRLEKISRDHSLYQLWLDGGRIGREPGKRTIMQAVGISKHLSPHIASFTAVPGDSVLMCTDGLSGAVSIERMQEVLAGSKDSREACETLMQIVLRGPARDNVTISVCSF